MLSGVVTAFTSTAKSEQEKEAILAALAGTPLVDAYTSAIENKKSALSTFDSYVAEYNAAFTAWSGVLSAHDKWDEHEGYSVPSSHASDRLYTWKQNWSINRTLPSFSCGGGCGNHFDTPRGDHWRTCGSGLHVTIAAWGVAWQIKNNPSDELESAYPDAYDAIVNNDASLAFTISSIERIILKTRTVSEGCGRGYYSCNQSSEDLHSVRSCNEQRTWVDENGNVTKTGTCNDQFRNCIGHFIDHNPTDASGETPHTDDPPGLFPVGVSTITIDGEEMVDAAPDDMISVNLVPKAGGITQIYWYLAGPDDTGLGDRSRYPTYPPADDVEADVSHSFSIPSDASGVYTFTAYIYPHSNAPDQTVYEYSFKIYVS